MIETLDDIVENIADKLNVYGADRYHCVGCVCRVCFTADLKQRIQRAVRIQEVLEKAGMHE